jgi:hypothetical protein
MSYEFGGLDATEKAGMEAALNRCRGLAAQIESELRNTKREHFVDELLSLADLYTSLECLPMSSDKADSRSRTYLLPW